MEICKLNLSLRKVKFCDEKIFGMNGIVCVGCKCAQGYENM